MEPLVHGTWNSVYLLQPKQLVLKLSPWSNSYEVDFLNFSAHKNLAIPEIVAYGSLSDTELSQADYLLMHYIPNTANPNLLLQKKVLPQHALNAIGAKVATILATLHEQKFDYVRSSDTIFNNWAAAIHLDVLSERMPFDAGWIDKLEYLLKETQYRAFREGHLIHSDANLNNILIDKDDYEFRALIDPGPTIIGMPMFDLAYATWPWQYGLAYMETIIETYKSMSSYFDETLFYTSLMYIAYQQTEYGNFTKGHLPFLNKHIASKLAL